MTINDKQQSVFQLFSKLHSQSGNQQTHSKQSLQESPALVLVNIWDAASAAIMQARGAKAIATSSASLAWSLGYADGNTLPKQELLAAIDHILRVVDIPLSVDIEAGYSDDPVEVAKLAQTLQEKGVAGINIEDGTDPSALLVDKIQSIKSVAPKLFINARCDVYLANLVAASQQLSETKQRLERYKAAGANGIFVPGLIDTQIAHDLQSLLALPVNLMAANESQIEEFNNAGIARISLGPASFIQAYKSLIKTHSKTFSETGNDSFTNKTLDYNEMNQLFDSQ